MRCKPAGGPLGKVSLQVGDGHQMATTWICHLEILHPSGDPEGRHPGGRAERNSEPVQLELRGQGYTSLPLDFLL